MEHRWTEAELRQALDDYEDQLRQAGKARNTIATYVQHPERFINWLAGSYQPRQRAGGSKQMSKYDPLSTYLKSLAASEVKLTFQQVEGVLGQPLPASARRYRPWWANETGGTHTHARAWLDAGWRTRAVDLQAETVVFHR